MKKLTRIFFEILIGLFILIFTDTTRWFLLYFFMVFLITTNNLINYQLKLIKISHLSNSIKILAIIRKLKITEDELSIVVDSLKINPEQMNELEDGIKKIYKI